MKTRRLFRMHQIVKPVLFTLLFALVFAVYTSPAGAQTIVDPQIYVCTGCTAPPGTDPNPINSNTINVGFAGNHTAAAPLLIIVGVPGATSTTGPTISLPTGVSLMATGNYYGASTNKTLTGTLDGFLTAVTSDAYTAVGLNPETNSESFTNWTTSPFPGGATNPDTGVTSFGLYVYAISYALNSGAGGNSPINIDFSGLPTGSYVIAYNCATLGSPTSTQCGTTTTTKGDIGDTPFTNAGFVTSTAPTPEPNTLFLFGLGTLALGLVMRRRLLPGDDASRMSVA